MKTKIENDCLSILTHLVNNNFTTVGDIESATHIPNTEIRRYLLYEFFEYWKWDRLLDLRTENPKLYKHIISTAKPMTDKVSVRVNTSKRQFLDYYADIHGFKLIKCDLYPYFKVVKRNESDIHPCLV